MNIFGFLGEVKSELAKVVWPTKTETLKYTLTVIVFSLVVAFLLGAFDYGILRVLQSIISRKS
jgi:preprotein translocase subunit SecE